MIDLALSIANNPNSNFEKLLTNLDLTSKEAHLLLVSLQYGRQPASILAKKAKMPRSSVFVHLNNLIKKGFMTKEIKSNISYYQSVSLDELKNRFQRKTEKVKNNFQSFTKLIPLIETFAPDKSLLSSKIIHFEGIEGIKRMYDDILATNSDLHVISGYSLHPEIREYLIENFIPLRLKSKKKAHLIINPKETIGEYLEISKDVYDEIYLMRDIKDMQLTIRIYGNKLALISGGGDDFTGIVIDNKIFADDIRTLFEMLKRSCKKYQA